MTARDRPPTPHSPAHPPVHPPVHPDFELLGSEIGFARHLRVEVVRFRHRLFAGGWSGERVFDVVRRGAAVAVLLYDPERDKVVLVEQFRVAALYGGRSPWQVEAVAGLVDSAETPAEVARREAREEANLDPLGPLLPIQTILPQAAATTKWYPCSAAGSIRAAPRGSTASHRSRRISASSSRPWPKSRRCSIRARSRAPTPSFASIGCCATATGCAADGRAADRPLFAADFPSG
jgi:hypothetical protein